MKSKKKPWVFLMVVFEVVLLKGALVFFYVFKGGNLKKIVGNPGLMFI